jgi:hypothetical protein
MINKLSKIAIAIVLSTLLFSCSDEGSSNSDEIVNEGNGGDVGNDSGSVEGGTYNGEDATVESDSGDVTANGGDGGDVGFSGNTSVEGGTYIGEDGEDATVED